LETEDRGALLWLYGERLKSELHIAFQLLDEMERLAPDEIEGGRRMAQAFFEALRHEVRLSANVLDVEDMDALEGHVIEAAGRAALSEFTEARGCLAKAISVATSIAARGNR